MSLSVSQLCNIQLKAETMWNDSQAFREMYKAEAETAKALGTNQGTIRITELQDTSRKDNAVVKVTWLDSCAATLSDCSDVCEINGDTTTVKSKDFDVTLCKQAEFSIDENDLLGNSYSFDELVARKLMQYKKGLDEWVNQKSIEFLSLSAGNNVAPNFSFDIPTLTSQVPSANYNKDLVKAMYKEVQRNNIANGFIVDSGNLWDFYIDTMLQGTLKEDQTDQNISKLFNSFIDFKGFASTGVDQDSFFVGQNSYAFWSKVWNSSLNIPVEYGGNVQQSRWHVMSDNIPGMKYDVYYTYDCSGKRLLHKWKLVATPFFGLNPEGCGTSAVTGILGYKRIA